MSGLAKGSIFNFGDQGIFYSAIDMGCKVSKTGAENRTAMLSALNTIKDAGGGVLIVPHGITSTFDYASDFPVTANALMVIELTGNKFKVHSNQTVDAALGDSLSKMFLADPAAISYEIVDANPATYTFKLKVYNNVDTPVISGSSYDLCFFLPGGVNPVAVIARSGSTPGRLFLKQGLDVVGDTVLAGNLQIAGQVQSSKAIITPVAAGSHQIADTVQYLVMDHAATIATFTITLPKNPQDGNVVKIFSRSIVTTLTLSAGTGETIATGHTVTTIAALGSLEYVYNSSDSKWYRVR